MSSQASRDELADHNARVRRLACAYAPKYQPLVLVLGYAEDLSQPEGYTKLKLETINKKTARYRGGKLYSERQLQRLLAELTKTEPSAALKTEATFGRNGHQGATVRYLNHHVSVDRHGFSVVHDWYAPLGDAQDWSTHWTSDTQDVTPPSPQMSPRMSPLSTGFDLVVHLVPSLLPEPDRYADQDQDQTQEPGEDPDPWFTWYLWRASSGDLAVFCEMDQGFDPRFVPSRAIVICLRPPDGKWLWDTLASWGSANTVENRALLLAREFCTDKELAELGIHRERPGDAAQADITADADADAALLAGEIDSYKGKLITETGLAPGNVDYWIRGWRELGMDDRQVLERLRLNLEKRVAA
jgi:hypothetical protein